jgi:hypothetical protein
MEMLRPGASRDVRHYAARKMFKTEQQTVEGLP